MKKTINFLDKHRFILIIIILLIISLTFIGLKSIIFLNHHFAKLECTRKKDNISCFNQDIEIYINPEEEKEKIFQEKKKELKNLKEKYKLPEFNFYTSYYYEVSALLHYNETDENEDILRFFEKYNASYKISDFYKKNILYYDLFYHYKITLN